MENLPGYGNDRYCESAKEKIRSMLKAYEGVLCGEAVVFPRQTPANQLFIILDNEKMEELKKSVRFSFWEKYDAEHTVVRFSTSWATKIEEVNALEALL